VEERAAEPAEEHACPAFTDYRRMLDKVERDALYVCVPPFAHEDAELRAAERGIHLFVEKVVMEVGNGVVILELSGRRESCPVSETACAIGGRCRRHNSSLPVATSP